MTILTILMRTDYKPV